MKFLTQLCLNAIALIVISKGYKLPHSQLTTASAPQMPGCDAVQLDIEYGNSQGG
ncbi:hypothetical protein [Nostoc sp.]|uniref:hypothetical protein n=1 Tax=Nostoc sp. TaxID=1180 RepID=UPI002FF67910